MKRNKAGDIEKISEIIIPVLRRNGVVEAGIFGSFARGEAGRKSDIDILIRFHGRKSLLDLVGLKLELEKSLGRNVDVAEYSVIHPLLRDRILKEEVKVLRKGM
jgi:predicted nucleotidyltransferase